MSPLERLIRARIAADGPMSVSDYMAACLAHPEHGYYRRRDPIGACGDFVTAPEVSQLFGEMIGGWLGQAWLDRGRPEAVLAELGPGRGTLLADALRVARRVPGFLERVEVVLVETSPVLRARQAEALAAYAPRWVERVEALPERPALIVANEFFDALPVRQFLRLDQGWQERMVTVERERLAWTFGPTQPLPALDMRFPGLRDGAVVDVAEAGEAVARAIGRAIGARGGVALVIDYGAWDGVGDTLQAVAGHRRVEPLAAPGEADLTVHVRFRDIATASGLVAWGPVAQGMFLERLGITARARALAARASGAAVDRLISGHRRLTHPDEMGNLFQAMALVGRNEPAPPGFEGPCSR